MLTSEHTHEAQHGGVAEKCSCCGQKRKVVEGAICCWHKMGCSWPDAGDERRPVIVKTERRRA